MKKNHLVLFSALAYILVQTGCNWQLPKSVAVETNAEYNFSVGEVIDQDFSESLDKDQLFSSISSSVSNSMVYDYNPGGDTDYQQFLIKIPLAEIPVNFGSYFENSNLASQIEGLSFSKTVEIPEIEIAKTQTIESDTLSAAINASFSFSGTTAGGTLAFLSDFTSVTYSSGSITITCSGSVEDGSSVTLTSNGVSRTGTFSSNSASIDISNFTIYKNDCSISFTTTTTCNFAGVIASSSIISNASGVTIESPIALSDISTTIDLSSLSSTFETCTIESGSLVSEITLPSGWSNVDISYEMSAAGGISFTSDQDGSKHTVDLSGKTITPASTTVDCDVSLTLTNASFNSSSISLVITSDIEKFTSIVLNLTGLNTNVSASQAFSSSITDTVKSITLGQCGLEGTYKNTFPSGNDITITASSDFFGLTEEDETVASNTSDGTLRILTEDTTRTVTLTTSPSGTNEFSEWDFNVDIGLPGATDSDPSKITISGVSPGADYEISLTLTPVINWTQIVINTDNFSGLSNTQDLGFNLGSILDQFDDSLNIDLASNIDVSSLPVYLFCTKPDLDIFDSAAFEGTVRLFYGTSGTPDSSGSIVNIIGDAANSDPDEIDFVSEVTPELEDGVVVTDFADEDCSVKVDLANLMNMESTGTLHLDYDLSLTGSESGDLTITKDDFDSLSSDSSSVVGVVAYIALPLKLQTTAEVEIDVFDIVGTTIDHDIFGRSSASSLDSIEQFIDDVLESVTLSYSQTKQLFTASNSNASVTKPISLNVSFEDDSGTEVFAGQYSLTGDDEISLTKENVKDLLDVYPLIPSVKINIADDTTLSINRDLAMALSLNLQIKTDGKTTIFGGE